MNILWLSNVIFPEACLEIGIIPPVVGGWMYSGAQALLNIFPDINLGVVALYQGKELKQITKYKIQYFLVPSSRQNQKYDSSIEPWFKIIKKKFKPDLTHIHGTEYPHSLAWIKACGNEKVVASIQGLVYIYSDYYLGGISISQIRRTRTLRDFLRKDSLLQQQKKMKQRGEFEKDLLCHVNHVIGRTSWDKSNSWALNPNLKYHFCNESLRNGFYNYQWSYKQCQKYTLFLSQGHYPIKGIQQVLKALPLIISQFPETKIYVAGNNFIDTKFYRRNGFGNYLQQQMKALAIADRVVFLGPLSEEEMINQYLKAHVFICPSSIENSPNSVGEAQLLGTPCVASYVGGTMDMIRERETGFLYRFEETNMLAVKICEIFKNRNLAEKISIQSRIEAAKRHDKEKNARVLEKIYRSIINENFSDL